MATRTETHLVDDCDGQPADETVQFALDGQAYEIDLSIKHAEDLRDALAQWVAYARKVSGSRKRRREPAEGSQPAARREQEAPKVREWAREHGIEVPARGRIPAEVVERYRADPGSWPAPLGTGSEDEQVGPDGVLPTIADDPGDVEVDNRTHSDPPPEDDGFEWDDPRQA